MFAPYGNILEIVLKGSYGFVQFDNPEACRRAMENEAGRKVAGLSIGNVLDGLATANLAC